jgi:GAF domain-containing protein
MKAVAARAESRVKRPREGGDAAALRKRLDVLLQLTHTIWGSLELDEVLRHIIAVVGELAEADAVLLYLLDRERHELVLRASSKPHPDLVGVVRLKLGEGVTGWAAQHREPVAIARNARDDHRFKFFAELPEDRSEAFLAVPVLHRGKLVGVVNAHYARPREFDRGTIDLVSAIAQQAGGAIENARLYEDALRKAQQVEMLSKVSGAVASSSYLEEILHLIVTVAAETTHSHVCSLMLLNEEKGELIIAATQSLSEAYKNKPPIKVGQSVSGLAVRDGKPLAIPDVQSDARYAYPDVARQDGLRSLLCVPMMLKNRALGVLNVYTTAPHAFTADETQLLQAAANQAAVAIQNTRLLSETISMREALESRKVIERAKGILMNELNLSEDKAFKLIQRKSMDSTKPMKEIAEAIILAAEMREDKPAKKPR